MAKLLHPEYVNLSEIKAAVDKSELRAGADEELTIISNGVWRKAKSYMARELVSLTFTHDGTTLPGLTPENSRELFLYSPPITGITTLKPYEDAAEYTHGWNDDYTLNEQTGHVRLVRGLGFGDRDELVECTYTGGFLEPGNSDLTSANAHRFAWEDAGADIKHSIIVQTADLYQRKVRGRERVVSFTTDGGSFTVSSGALLDDVRAVWDSHRMGIL